MLETDPVFSWKIGANLENWRDLQIEGTKDPCLPHLPNLAQFSLPKCLFQLLLSNYEAKLESLFILLLKSSLLIPLQLFFTFNYPSICISQRSSYAFQLKYSDIWKTNLSSAWHTLLGFTVSLDLSVGIVRLSLVLPSLPAVEQVFIKSWIMELFDF